MDWELTPLDVLEALGHHEEAQTFRWECFKRSLDGRHLRGCLKHLPEFDDVEAEERALERFTPAANALEAKHPLAATVLRRAMIGFTLNAARSKRYRHAARHLLECASLSGSIEGFGRLEPHEKYLARLKAQHGRKIAFWDLLRD